MENCHDKKTWVYPEGSLLTLLTLVQVDYTYGQVVATLAAVENSNPDIYICIDDHSSDQDPTKPSVPSGIEDATLSHPSQPVTTGFRSTIKHLRAQAGFWSRLRGLSAYLCFVVPQVYVMILLSSSKGTTLLVVTCLNVLLAPLHLAWVHIVISQPSPRRFYQRIPHIRTCANIAPAIALRDGLSTAVYFATAALMHNLRWKALDDLSPSILSLGLPALMSAVVRVPTHAIFVRVAASMLPEEDETIVPFDRSFGGKIQPRVMGEGSHLGLLDAWQTFDRPARLRYGWVIIKTFFIEVFLGVFLLITWYPFMLLALL